jgi:hypothetical protein
MMLPDIPRRNDLCSQCNQKIARGTTYHSALCHSSTPSAASTERRDYCQGCWKLWEDKALSVPMHWHWCATLAIAADAERAPQPKVERALALLKERLLTPEEQFVVALFLMRQRRLILRKEIVEGEMRCQIFEEAATEEMVTVPKIDLSTVDVMVVQHALAVKLAAVPLHAIES